MSGLKLLVSDHHGIYVPHTFLTHYDENQWNVLPEDAHFIEDGPENESYWDAWNYTLDNASYKDENGNIWRLHQDGDLWAYCPELMSDQEYKDFFGEERN